MLKKIILSAISMIFFTTFQNAFAMQEILPLSKIHGGEVGVAYTEISPSGALTPFNISVMGINGDKNTAYIMARASGDLINATNGVLQGMSGSPVYVDGKLIGAVSAGFKGMDQKVCFITPIEEMRKLWKMPDRKNKREYEEFDLKKAIDTRREEEKTSLRKKAEKILKAAKDKVKHTYDEMEAAKKKSEEDKKNVKADKQRNEAKKNEQKDGDKKDNASPNNKDGDKIEKVNVFLLGFNDAGRSFLLDTLFKGKNINVFDNAVTVGFGSKSKNAPLIPGSAMGAAITCGDFAIGATGTVTDVDGARVLGFGHSFTHRGNVNYYLTHASVVGPVPSNSDSGARMAVLGDVIGRINQDREMGIAGILNQYPETVTMKMNVVDFALGRSNLYKSYIAYDEELLAPVASVLTYASVAKTTDTTNEATARVTFSFKSDIAENGAFKRENMFYAPSDVGKVAILEMMEALNLATKNSEKDSFIRDIDVKIEVAEGRRTAKLVSAIPDKVSAKPGDKVNFRVTLRPYRGKDETVTVPYYIPYTQPKGNLTLDVKGGGLVPLTMQNGIFAEEGVGESAKIKLKKLEETSKNNDIVITPGLSREVVNEKEQKAMIQRAIEAQKKAEEKFGAKKLKNPPKNEPTPTSYIIENFVKTRIKIEG